MDYVLTSLSHLNVVFLQESAQSVRCLEYVNEITRKLWQNKDVVLAGSGKLTRTEGWLTVNHYPHR